MTGTDFIVDRKDWRQCRFVAESIPTELEPGQVLFDVDRFALTSNNISYAGAGDMLKYWSFFPAEAGWGRIPAMGYGDVVASRSPDVAEGERFFGFFPMSNHLLVQADQANTQQFVDAAPHRQETAPVYRQYSRVAADALYDAAHEDELIVLRGLFMTSFLVDDFLADEGFFGGRQVVIASASSKTAIALAYLLAARGSGGVVGLTSERNRGFVERLGYYDRTLGYDEVKTLSPDEPTVFVDMAGNGDVVNAVHRHFGDQLVHSCLVGGTHWNAAPRAKDLPGAVPTFFFAPGQIQKRAAEWGPGGLQERLGQSWQGFRDASSGWLRIVRGSGREDLERVYLEVLEGRARPDEGHVLSLR